MAYLSGENWIQGFNGALRRSGTPKIIGERCTQGSNEQGKIEALGSMNGRSAANNARGGRPVGGKQGDGSSRGLEERRESRRGALLNAMVEADQLAAVWLDQYGGGFLCSW